MDMYGLRFCFGAGWVLFLGLWTLLDLIQGFIMRCSGIHVWDALLYSSTHCKMSGLYELLILLG